jgi:hypothetical protein
MILVDTSVLIDYFRNRTNDGTLKFEEILNRRIPFGINSVIYLELLQGTADSREYDLLKKYLSSQTFYHLNDPKISYENAALIYRQCRMKGITVRSTIDLLIAQTAIENQLYLLHHDSDYDHIAQVLPELKIY